MTSSTITAPAVRSRACPLCDTPAGQPCQDKPSGDHLARYLDAYTAGQLTREYMAAVLGELVVVDGCAVIAGDEPVQMPAALFGPVLGRLLEQGCKLTYVPDPEFGGVFADVRHADGRLIDTGNGFTAGEALAHLRERLERQS